MGDHRGLACSKDTPAGETVFSLPWIRALTPRACVRAFERDEKRKHGRLQENYLVSRSACIFCADFGTQTGYCLWSDV